MVRKYITRRNLASFSLDLVGITLILTAIAQHLSNTFRSSIEIDRYQIITYALGLLATFFSSELVAGRLFHLSLWFVKAPSNLVFTASLVLLGINILGMVIPLRNPEVYQEINFSGVDRKVEYTARQVYQQMDRKSAIDEQYPAYVKRLT